MEISKQVLELKQYLLRERKQWPLPNARQNFGGHNQFSNLGQQLSYPPFFNQNQIQNSFSRQNNQERRFSGQSQEQKNLFFPKGPEKRQTMNPFASKSQPLPSTMSLSNFNQNYQTNINQQGYNNNSYTPDMIKLVNQASELPNDFTNVINHQRRKSGIPREAMMKNTTYNRYEEDFSDYDSYLEEK